MLFHNLGKKGTTKRRIGSERRRASHKAQDTKSPPLPPVPKPLEEHEDRRIRWPSDHQKPPEFCGFGQEDEVGVKPARLPAAAVAPNTVVQPLHPATFHSPAFDSPSLPMLTTWNGGECLSLSVSNSTMPILLSLCMLDNTWPMEFQHFPFWPSREIRGIRKRDASDIFRFLFVRSIASSLVCWVINTKSTSH